MTPSFIKAFGENPEAFSNKIYALCDFETLQKKSISLDTFVNLSKKYDVKVVQYRDKVSSLEEQQKNLIYLKKQLNIPLIINDKVELIDYADGLHVGQEDLEIINVNKTLAIKLLRKKIGNKLLGLSTHNEIEILEANELDLDMIGLGAYRNTATKDVDSVLGEKLSYLAKISKHPVCAIGGVKKSDTLDNVTFKVIGSDLYVD